MDLLIRWAVAAIGLCVAAAIVPGIDRDSWSDLFIAAAVIGVVNALIKPVLKLLALPLVPITLGLILLVINVFCFWFGSWVSEEWLDSGFTVDGLGAAIGGALVVSIISFIASMIVKD